MSATSNTEKWTYVPRASTSAVGGAGSGSGSGSRGGWASERTASKGGREMPSAFGGGERRPNRFEEQRQREAEIKYKEDREKAAAARHHAKMMDFKNMNEYPSLGGAPVVVAKPVLDFRAASERGVAVSVAQEAREAKEAERNHELYRESLMERMEDEARAALRRRLAQITTHCYDDGFDEHEPPEEDDAAYAGHPCGDEMPTYDEDDTDINPAHAESKADGEFNSHLAVTRRRGDKSNW
jgi:hypothetical protein